MSSGSEIVGRLLRVALVASLAANGYLWLSASRHASGAAHAHEVVEAARPAQPPAQDCAPCEAQLRQYRNASFAAVAEAIGRRAGDVASREDVDDPAAGGEDRPAASAQLQQDVLSQIALEHLRRHWEGSHEDILAVVRRDLTDPGKQADDLETDVGVLTGVLGLSGPEASKFGDAYAAERARHIDAARVAITKEPPEWDSLLAAARGLFASEDALAEQWGGAAGRDRVRLSQVDKRTAILAIAATYADKPWDDSISW